ncbi:MAG: tetratricopeptide repeat protein [Anaerolineae bacterium]|nr:tetratricopeptide repeat protein [Anaerolineae bacterium]
MRCPLCGTANPAQARFCMGCGQLLVGGLVCTVCHTLLPGHARYCFHCGAIVVPPVTVCPECGAGIAPGQVQCSQCGAPVAQLPAPAAADEEVLQASSGPGMPQAARTLPTVELGQLPPPRPLQEMLPSLQRYLTHALYEPMERRATADDLAAASQHLAGVLKTAKTYLARPVVQNPQPPGVPAGGLFQGAFLFVDVSGFTPLSEWLKPFEDGAERITAIINSLFNDLVAILHAHGGTLLKFGGDALLGLFGEQPAGSAGMTEGALLAVQAAMAMQGIMDRFAAIEAGGQTHALRVKCGISSGRYFAAHLGTAHSMAYVTTGHTVNGADQAEGHANPGEVVITRATRDLLGSRIVVESRAEGFDLVRAAPPAESLPGPWHITEPPDGDVQAQITYLVDRLDRLSPYLPAELLSRLVTSPGQVRIVPDRRLVTVMFVNYEGASDLIEDMGGSRPDLITSHLNDYFVHMAEIVGRYEGSLARMDQYSIGDRLVVFFGAPRAHEDDPVRAVYAALEMQEATRQYFAALQLPEGIYRFRQRVGINTGTLFAGNVGVSDIGDQIDRPDRRQEYTLMGDDINMAARLMSKAEWGGILISDRTQEQVKAFFDLRDRGQLKVKGKEIAIPSFQVMGRRAKIGRTRGLGDTETPLADREDELTALQRCGKEFMNGRGQIVSIVGDSGLGKSRLMRELRGRLFGQQPSIGDRQGVGGMRWLQGQAVSFSEQVSYWLAAQILHRAVAPRPDANADDMLYALWEQGEALLGKPAAREAIPFLAHLLDLPLKGEWERWVNDLNPQVRQKQTFWAVREFCAAAAQQQPLVIALDDLHWADEASLALLEDLLQVTDIAPLMFVLVLRERRDKRCWRLRDQAAASFPHRYTEVALRPLSETWSRELLHELLPGADLAPLAIQEILDKTAGNPFYLEEVVRSLQDRHLVVPDDSQPGYWKVMAGIERITVPSTLQGAILARLDRLTEDARQALQMAAVIGRRFQVEILRGLVGAQAEMGLWLAQLERSGLIRPVAPAAGQPTDVAYTFPDALVQEVAYDSLLLQSRQEFHRRAGETLKAILGELADQECEMLAYHFSRSDDQQQAAHYLEMAGHKAQAGFANETAVRCYTDVLERLERQFPDRDLDPETWQRQFDVLTRRQQVYGLLGQQKARQVDLEEMLDLAQAHDDQARRSDALNALADLYQWTGRYVEAEQAATEALAIATELGALASQAEALHQLGVIHYYRGDYAKAQPPLEKAAGLRRATNDSEGEAWSLMYLGMIHFFRGNYSQAVHLYEQAFEVAEARQDWFQVGVHLTNAARVSMRLGEYERALDQYITSLDRKRRVGDRMGQGFALFGLGLVYTYLGRYDEAELAFNESLELRRQIDDQRGIGYCWYGLGLLALGRREYDRAVDCFQQAYEIRSQLGLKAEMVVDLSYLGQAYLELGRLDQAFETSEQAIVLLAEQKNVEEVQQIYFNHFRVLAARQKPEAGRFLQEAYTAMIQQAERIDDPQKRQVFLEQSRVNQQIVAEVKSGRWGVAQAPYEGQS